MPSEFADDFLALEPVLAARVKSVLPAEVHVLRGADMATVKEATQPTPAVHVLFQSHRPAGSGAAGLYQIDQVWLTVVAVRHAADMRGGAGARATAGPMIATLIRALGTWVPPLAGAQKLTLETGPGAGYSGSFAYFPLAWRAGFKGRLRDGA